MWWPSPTSISFKSQTISYHPVKRTITVETLYGGSNKIHWDITILFHSLHVFSCATCGGCLSLEIETLGLNFIPQ